VFLGQTDDLQHRIERHLEVSEARGLPDWLWNTKEKPLSLSVGELPGITRNARQGIEILLAKKWKPLLNLRRVA